MTNQSSEPFSITRADSQQDLDQLSSDARKPSNNVKMIRASQVLLVIMLIIVLPFSILALIVGKKSETCFNDDRIKAWLIVSGGCGLGIVPYFLFSVS